MANVRPPVDTHGVHAGCIEDMWQVAIEIAMRAGGDRGHPGLVGPVSPPAAIRPNRLAVMEGDGWKVVDNTSKSAFEALLQRLSDAGVEVLRRGDEQAVENLEGAVEGAGQICSSITSWENRWAQRNLVNESPNGVSERAKATLAKAEAMSPADYRSALSARAAAQVRHSAGPTRTRLSACLAQGRRPCSPTMCRDNPGTTADGRRNLQLSSSMLFAPAVTMPMIGVAGLPVGVQVVGQQGEDARMTAIARWMVRQLSRLSPSAFRPALEKAGRRQTDVAAFIGHRLRMSRRRCGSTARPPSEPAQYKRHRRDHPRQALCG